MKTMTLDEFQSALRAQGVPRVHLATKCPACGTVQSMADLIAAGAGATEADVEKYAGYSCVGRFTKAGGHQRGMPPGRGCDWTLGGLFKIQALEVITPDGKAHPTFEVATAEEAQAHMRGEPQKHVPVGIQLSRAKGWRMPPNTVKVDRTTKWGNPIPVTRSRPAARCVELLRAALAGYLPLSLGKDKDGSYIADKLLAYRETVKHDIGELRGQNLACWCGYGTPCHRDLLLELANA